MANENTLLTREEAAQFLGVKPQTLAVWACHQVDGPAYVKVGRRTVRYRLGDLQAFIEKNTVRPQ